MLQQAWMLMFVGTGMVFVFLVLMVGIMQMVGRYFQSHAAAYQEQEDHVSGGRRQAARQQEPIVAAIAVALRQVRT